MCTCKNFNLSGIHNRLIQLLFSFSLIYESLKHCSTPEIAKRAVLGVECLPISLVTFFISAAVLSLKLRVFQTIQVLNHIQNSLILGDRESIIVSLRLTSLFYLYHKSSFYRTTLVAVHWICMICGTQIAGAYKCQRNICKLVRV